MFSMAPDAGWQVLAPAVSLQWFACVVASHAFALVPTEAQLLAAVPPEQVFASAAFLHVFAPALPP